MNQLEFVSYEKEDVKVIRNHPLCSNVPRVFTAVAKEKDCVLIGSLVFYDSAPSGMFDVHYLDKFVADNRHPSGFIKAETKKPSKLRITTSRLIDRSIRPLIEPGTFDFQIVIRLVNYDHRSSIVRPAITLASDLLIQAGLIDSHVELHGKSWGPYYLWMSTYKSSVTMMEAALMEMPLTNVVQFLRDLNLKDSNLDLSADLDPWEDKEVAINLLRTIEATYATNAKETQLDKVIYSYPNGVRIAQQLFSLFVKVRGRLDGRKRQELRNLRVESNLLSKPETNVLVTRGNTKVLSSLICSKEPQTIDEATSFSKENTNVQYDMLGHAVGATARVAMPNRREVGHGTLIYNSVKSTKSNDSNSIYVQNDVLRCAGSSSMAGVIGTSACMYLGNFAERLVAGVAVGSLGDEDWLVDLNEAEDWLGCMDLKLATSVEGITSLQADFKSKLFSVSSIVSAIELAHLKALELLEKVNLDVKGIARKNIVREEQFNFPFQQEQLKKIIGFKGFNFKFIQRVYKVGIDLDKERNQIKLLGTCQAIKHAREYLNSIVQEPIKEQEYEVTVVTKVGANSYLIQPDKAQSGYMQTDVFLHPYSRVLVRFDSLLKKGDFNYVLLKIL